MRLFGLVVAALVFASLVMGGDEGKEETRLTDRQTNQLLHADLVVLGTIDKLGPKPKLRSGVVKVRQVVVYRIERVLAGRCPLKRIAIHHLVAGGPTAHPDPKQTGLHPKVFKPGRKVIVAATVEKSPEGFRYLFVSDDERVAPLAVSQRAKVERLLVEQSSAADAVAKLEKGDAVARQQASQRLSRIRAKAVRAMVEQLQRLSQAPSRKYRSAFHLTLDTIGTWRVEEAAPILAQLVAFSLDRSTFPVGDLRHPSAYFPAALAVSRVGGKQVITGMLDQIAKNGEEQTRRVCTWVLRECVGAGGAKALLRQRLDSAPVKERERLTEASALLDKPTILRMPKK